MSKNANMVVLFLGVFLLVFCVVVLGDVPGCDADNCQGAQTGDAKNVACSNAKYYDNVGRCQQTSSAEQGIKYNCHKSGTPPSGGNVHCGGCKCGYKTGDITGTVCTCKLEGLSSHNWNSTNQG